jgi:hypothetical protein
MGGAGYEHRENTLSPHLRRVVCSVVAVLALSASPASATDLVTALDGCEATPVSRAFLRFADPLLYSMSAEGDFERGGAGWRLAGARVVSGNEAFDLSGTDDASSLRLDAGGSATSPANCVSLLHPTARFVARSTGSPFGLLRVDAVSRGGDGLLDVTPIGIVTGLGSAWKPTLPMVLTAGMASSPGDTSVDVRLRFTVLGFGGAFQIDDVYIDPYGRGR